MMSPTSGMPCMKANEPSRRNCQDCQDGRGLARRPTASDHAMRPRHEKRAFRLVMAGRLSHLTLRNRLVSVSGVVMSGVVVSGVVAVGAGWQVAGGGWRLCFWGAHGLAARRKGSCRQGKREECVWKERLTLDLERVSPTASIQTYSAIREPFCSSLRYLLSYTGAVEVSNLSAA